MKTLILFILGFLTTPHFVDEGEKIIWQEDRKLGWNDFRGVPNAADEFVASTSSGISFSFSYSEKNGSKHVDYSVLSNFYPDQSWYRPERVSSYILEHEQTHFDISELHARKLRKALESLVASRTFKEEAEKLYNQIELERREMQTLFDKESDHSNIKEAEYRWRKSVAEQLKSFAAWK